MKTLSFFIKTLSLTLLLFIFSSCKNDLTELSNVSPAGDKDSPPAAGAKPDSTTAVPEDSCDWVRKREFECDGVTYIAGLPICHSQMYSKSVFCKKEFENNLSACLNDTSPQTQRCRFEKIGRHLR